ncbi:outer membrane beta-barrel protein [Pontibacter sp. H249]|uniref:outer membrane beta-barrel protein n=1 Tax=Pontibacter sp. H249 TaxID=3133420 RepID=UPI0030BE756B
MKKILLSGLLALISVGAFAQTTQGSISVGGDMGLGSHATSNINNEYSDDTKGININLSPSVGYFVKNGLEIGLRTTLSFGSSTTQHNRSDVKNKINSFGYGLGPFVTKYVPITERLHFTATGGFGFDHERTKNPDLDQKLLTTTTGYYVSAAPGLTFFATEKLGFSIAMGGISYTTSTEKVKYNSPETETTRDNFNLTFSPGSSHIGIRYYINR